MPLPAALAIPAAAGPAAAMVAHAAHAASIAAPYAPSAAATLSSSTIAAVLARSAWRSLPAWVRDDPSFRAFSRRKYDENADDDDENEKEEMASLASVLQKLDEMITSGSRKLGTKLTHRQLHAAMLAYVQLSNQLRVRCPEARDRLYANCGHRCAGKGGGGGGGDDDGRPEIETASPDELRALRRSVDFATWSYVDYYGEESVRARLESVDYYLLSHNLSDVPGRVGHFVAVSPEERTLLIGVKGTSTLEDLITDAAGRAVGCPLLRGGEEGCEEGISVEVDPDHESIVVSTHYEGSRNGRDNDGDNGDDTVDDSGGEGDFGGDDDEDDDDGDDEERGCDGNNVSGEGSSVIDDDDEPHESVEAEVRRGENILVTVDGTTVRCHEGVLLSARRLADEVRSTVEQVALGGKFDVLIAGHSLGAGVAAILGMLLRSAMPALAERDAVRVHAVAPPPVLDVDGSVACATYVTSVVNNADVIPRGSVANLAVLLELLTVLSERLEERGMGLGGPKRAACLMRKLLEGTGGDMLMTWEEIRDVVNEAHRKVDLRDPDHLYVPGRVLLLYDPWTDRGDLKNGANRKGEAKTKEKEEKKNTEETVRTAGRVRCSVTYGTAAPLRLFEVDALRMVTDHLTTSHEAGIDALLPEEERAERNASMEGLTTAMLV